MSRWRRRLASLLVALTIGGAGAVAVAMPANAATGTLTGCFQASYNLGYGTRWGPYSNGNVQVQAWVDGAAYVITTVKTNANGCAIAPVVSGYSWRLCVNEYRVGYRVAGCSQWQWVAGAYAYTVPTTYLLYY